MERISLAAAFVAGLFSFLNPCVFPLVPGFLGYLSGVSLPEPRGGRARIFLNSLFFVLGFSCVFALIGVLLTTILQNVAAGVKVWLGRSGGFLIILFGLHLLGLIHIGFLEKEYKPSLKRSPASSCLTSFLFGAVFGVSWTPCVGAILGSVLALAASKPASSFLLLLAYALGLGLPFLVVGLSSSWAVQAIRRSARFLRFINIISGLFLLALGGLVFTDNLRPIVVERSVVLPAAVQGERQKIKEKGFPRAKEFISPDGFINSDPFLLKDLIGNKVILLDFWTYSCVNCLGTLPYLKAWHEKYKDEGLAIVAVHSPEFKFEKVYANVLAAVQKRGILYPVVLDNDHDNLRLYGVIYWPTKFLIDIDGFIVDKHVGEGGYAKTESKIRKLLDERKSVLIDIFSKKM